MRATATPGNTKVKLLGERPRELRPLHLAAMNKDLAQRRCTDESPLLRLSVSQEQGEDKGSHRYRTCLECLGRVLVRVDAC